MLIFVKGNLDGEFNIPLFEPLIIDSLSEVYLDNFISYNSNISNISEDSAFCLKINEFNINSNVASSNNQNTIFNSIVIPNEHNNPSNNQSMVIHKAKKIAVRNGVGKVSNARVYDVSKKYDLAILELEKPFSREFAIDEKDFVDPRPGEDVLIFGYPDTGLTFDFPTLPKELLAKCFMEKEKVFF